VGALDVVQPGLHAGSCRPHEVLFIMGCLLFLVIKEHPITDFDTDYKSALVA